MKYRIFVADDHRIVRDGLRSLIENEDYLEVLDTAENGRKPLQMARKRVN